MAMVVVEVSPLGAVTSAKIGLLLKQWRNSTNFAERQNIRRILTPAYNAQIINLANKGDVNAQQFQSGYISAEAATAAIEPVSTSGSATNTTHAGSSRSTSTTSSGHTGSSSSHSTSTTTSTTTSSSATNTTHADSNGGTTSAIKEVNPYLPIVSHSGNDSFKETSLDRTAGSWTFKFNDGTEITIDDYDKALIVEAALATIGKGPRPGAQAYAFSKLPGVEMSYEDAALYYRQELQEEVSRLNTIAEQRGAAKLDLDFADDAYMAALAAQQYDENFVNYETTPAEKKSNNWLWWILGGAAVLGVGIFISRKKKRR